MKRCSPPTRLGASALMLALAALWAAVPTAALAQSEASGIVRDIPADVKRASFSVTAAPEITLDGRPDRLSPGSRIRGTNNMLVLSAGITGQTFPVVYRRDAAGLVHEVWILSADEDARLSGASSSGARFLEVLRALFAARR